MPCTSLKLRYRLAQIDHAIRVLESSIVLADRQESIAHRAMDGVTLRRAVVNGDAARNRLRLVRQSRARCHDSLVAILAQS